MGKIDEVLFMREIEDCDYIMEVIVERFGDVVSNLSENSVMYGGAVRDALAGVELLGDLDISVDSMSYREVLRKFTVDPRWLRHRGDNVSLRGNYVLSEDPNKSPVSGLAVFKTLGAKTLYAQILKSNHLSPFYPAHKVDITCCGVAMTIDGRVFETAEGAHEDIKNVVLRVNERSAELNLDNLKARISKLESRGWKNKIDLNKVIKASAKKVKKVEQMEGPYVDKNPFNGGSVEIFTASNFAPERAAIGLLNHGSIILNSHKGMSFAKLRNDTSIESVATLVGELGRILMEINNIAISMIEAVYVQLNHRGSRGNEHGITILSEGVKITNSIRTFANMLKNMNKEPELYEVSQELRLQDVPRLKLRGEMGSPTKRASLGLGERTIESSGSSSSFSGSTTSRMYISNTSDIAYRGS